MGVLKSVEPTGFLAFAPAFAGTNWADVDRRIIQNCPHGRGRVLSSPPCLVPALPAWVVADAGALLLVALIVGGAIGGRD